MLLSCELPEPKVVFTDAKPFWQAAVVWQTLQPVPIHPLLQEQPAAVKFARYPEEATRGRCEPWNIVPPQPGCEHVAPPNPTGQRHDVPCNIP